MMDGAAIIPPQSHQHHPDPLHHLDLEAGPLPFANPNPTCGNNDGNGAFNHTNQHQQQNVDHHHFCPDPFHITHTNNASLNRWRVILSFFSFLVFSINIYVLSNLFVQQGQF